MCMAIPSRVVAIDGLSACVECFGVMRDVNLLLMSEEVEIGDYLLVQTGGFACEKVDPAQAQEALTLMKQVLSESLPQSEPAVSPATGWPAAQS